MYDEEAIREQIINLSCEDGSKEQESLRREAKYEGIASGLDALNKVCADLGLSPFADVGTGNVQGLEKSFVQCRQDIYNRGIGKGHEQVCAEDIKIVLRNDICIQVKTGFICPIFFENNRMGAAAPRGCFQKSRIENTKKKKFFDILTFGTGSWKRKAC